MLSTTRSTRIIFVCLLLTLAAIPQSKPEPLDGVNRPFHDGLLDHLEGHWKITGIIVGQKREMDLTAEWVLNHQFLFLDEKDATVIAGRPGLRSPYLHRV
jgi:hypothetical protein